MSSPKGPYRLVTVNTAPDRARRLVGRAVEALRDQYRVEHVANCESIDQVSSTVSELQPDRLFCASMWTPGQAEEIQSIARRNKPDIVTHAIPEGLQIERGPDAVVEYVVELIPNLVNRLEQSWKSAG